MCAHVYTQSVVNRKRIDDMTIEKTIVERCIFCGKKNVFTQYECKRDLPYFPNQYNETHNYYEHA